MVTTKTWDVGSWEFLGGCHSARGSKLVPLQKRMVRYRRPNFTESTPLGNGRLGAMMFGGLDEERIILNESSVMGAHQDADRPEAYKVLPEIQKLLLEGRNADAEALVNSKFICKGPGSSGGTGNGQYGCYQVLGNLHLTFSGNAHAPVENYRRELNLNEATAHVEFERAGVKSRERCLRARPIK